MQNKKRIIVITVTAVQSMQSMTISKTSYFSICDHISPVVETATRGGQSKPRNSLFVSSSLLM